MVSHWRVDKIRGMHFETKNYLVLDQLKQIFPSALKCNYFGNIDWAERIAIELFVRINHNLKMKNKIKVRISNDGNSKKENEQNENRWIYCSGNMRIFLSNVYTLL